MRVEKEEKRVGWIERSKHEQENKALNTQWVGRTRKISQNRPRRPQRKEETRDKIGEDIRVQSQNIRRRAIMGE